LTVKNIFPPASVIHVGPALDLPGRMFLTIRVPAAVPFVFQSSRPAEGVKAEK
jgi:hypothetical protein